MADHAASSQSIKRKQEYKKMLDKGQELSNRADTDDVIDTINHVKEILTQSDALSKEGRITDRANNSTEVVLDAQVIKMSHELIERAISKETTSEFNEPEYIAVLKNLINQEGSKNFTLIGEYVIDCSSFYHEMYTTMLGAFETDPVIPEQIVKERAKRTKQVLESVKRPEQLKKLESEGAADEVNSVMRQIFDLYQNNGRNPLSYYKVVVVPNNLMQTASNAFLISFLIKDGSLALENESSGPTIRPIEPTEKETLVATQKNHNQVLISFTNDIIEDLVKKYKIRTPLLQFEEQDEDEMLR